MEGGRFLDNPQKTVCPPEPTVSRRVASTGDHPPLGREEEAEESGLGASSGIVLPSFPRYTSDASTSTPRQRERRKRKRTARDRASRYNGGRRWTAITSPCAPRPIVPTGADDGWAVSSPTRAFPTHHHGHLQGSAPTTLLYQRHATAPLRSEEDPGGLGASPTPRAPRGPPRR